MDVNGRPGADFLKNRRERRVSPLQLPKCPDYLGNPGGTAETVFFALRGNSRGVFCLQEVITMLCPFCGEEMEKGLLQGGNILVWVKKKHYISLLPKEGEVLLDRTYLTNSSVPAFICKQCRKVIVEYEDNFDFEFE